MGAQNNSDSVSDQLHELRRKLHERVVELRFNGGFRVVAWTPLPNVSDHTDDLRLHIKSADMNVLTDGVLVRESSCVRKRRQCRPRWERSRYPAQ